LLARFAMVFLVARASLPLGAQKPKARTGRGPGGLCLLKE
jgi:hypothetical protein